MNSKYWESKQELFEMLNRFEYAACRVPFQDVIKRVSHIYPIRKSDVKCALSELVVYRALSSFNFNFLSTEDFQDTSYGVTETNYNLKFNKKGHPFVEFDFFCTRANEAYAVEVKAGRVKDDFNSLKALKFAESLVKAPVNLLVFASFKNQNDFNNCVASRPSPKIGLINTKLSNDFYEQEIKKFYSTKNSSDDELSDILDNI